MAKSAVEKHAVVVDASVLALNSVAEGVVTIDAGQRIVSWNRAAERMYGYSAHEMLSKPIITVVSPVSRAKYEMMMKEWFSRKEVEGPRVFESYGLRKDGTEFPAEVSYSYWKTIDGSFVTCVVHDLTERKHAEDRLGLYIRDLENLVEEGTRKLKEAERFVAIGQLAAMVGHDLRNPLMGIASAEYYLRTTLESKLDEKQRKMLKIIEENVSYSDKIIKDLQDYSKEIRLELTSTDPKTLLIESLSVVNVPESIQILDRTRRQPAIQVDVPKMKRVFSNIIRNAIEAMPNGGRLDVGMNEMENTIEFTFADTGMGMPKHVLREIGKPLFTTKARGMGFGLAICYRMIETHGGKMCIESIVNKGTTVKVVLPITCRSE